MVCNNVKAAISKQANTWMAIQYAITLSCIKEVNERFYLIGITIKINS